MPGVKAGTVAASPATAPTGTTAAAPGVGDLPWFTFEQFSLTSSAQVNVANRNLLLTATDLVTFTISAAGFVYSIGDAINQCG